MIQYEQYVRDLQAHNRAVANCQEAPNGISYQDLQQEVIFDRKENFICTYLLIIFSILINCMNLVFNSVYIIVQFVILIRVANEM